MEGNQPDLQDDAGFRSSDQMRVRSAGLAAPTGMNLRVFKNQANAFYVSIYVLNELLLMELEESFFFFWAKMVCGHLFHRIDWDDA